MIDPIFNFLNALFLIVQRLPAPLVSLIGVLAVFAVVVVVVKIVRSF